jgi:hypothetical protein
MGAPLPAPTRFRRSSKEPSNTIPSSWQISRTSSAPFTSQRIVSDSDIAQFIKAVSLANNSTISRKEPIMDSLGCNKTTNKPVNDKSIVNAVDQIKFALQSTYPQTPSFIDENMYTINAQI